MIHVLYDYGQTLSLIIAMHIGTRMWKGNEEIFDGRPSQAIRPRLAQLSAPSRTGFVAARNICCHNSAEQVPISSALNTHLLHLGFKNIQMQHFYRTQVWSLPALVTNWLPSWVSPVVVSLVAKDACPSVCLCVCEIIEHQAKNRSFLCRNVLHVKQGVRGAKQLQQ